MNVDISMTSDHRYALRFDYEHECSRIDAPEDGMGEWLNRQAEVMAKEDTGLPWTTERGKLEECKDGTHTYTVTLKLSLG